MSATWPTSLTLQTFSPWTVNFRIFSRPLPVTRRLQSRRKRSPSYPPFLPTRRFQLFFSWTIKRLTLVSAQLPVAPAPPAILNVEAAPPKGVNGSSSSRGIDVIGNDSDDDVVIVSAPAAPPKVRFVLGPERKPAPATPPSLDDVEEHIKVLVPRYDWSYNAYDNVDRLARGSAAASRQKRVGRAPRLGQRDASPPLGTQGGEAAGGGRRASLCMQCAALSETLRESGRAQRARAQVRVPRGAAHLRRGRVQ